MNQTVRKLAIPLALAFTLCCAALLTPASALAAAPAITATGFSEVTETSATLTATVDPGGTKVKPFRFEYISLGDYEAAGNSFGAGTIATPDLVILAGAPQQVSVLIEGLAPATAYRFRAFARNNQSGEEAFGPERILQTSGPESALGPCANDVFRSGEFAPLGDPGANLPDCRAYEQASPTEKDGGDAHAISTVTRAATSGAGIVWGSNFGAPGGTGGQELPFFAAMRDPGGAGWSSQGLLPPAGLGQGGKVLGWLPDFSETFAAASRFGAFRTAALFELHRDGRAPTQITPYVPGELEAGPKETFAYVGASSDGQTVVFESPAALPAAAAGGEALPGAVEGTGATGMNVYAWDAKSGQVSLLSRMNEEAENAVALPKGAFAGPYDWAIGRTRNGGSSNHYLLEEQHALSPDADSIYFTAYGTGQLYRRINPTEAQSPLDGEGKCTDPGLACTIHVSAPDRAEPDPTGSAPAAFQYASSDGSKVFFTSSEKLTEDANTGPVQPPAQIGHADLTAPDPDATKEPGFLPANAVGIATSADGEFIYWANPLTGNIGRANLKAPNPKATEEPAFIEPGTGECEVKVKVDIEVFEVQKLEIPDTPRYVALDPTGKYIFWTNTGLLNPETALPIDGGGTIGRAELDASGSVVDGSVDPSFICGETEPSPGTREEAVSNPQGIAANAEHVYWANAATPQEEFNRSLARAQIAGGGIEPEFVSPHKPGGFKPTRIPRGVAVDGSHVYFGLEVPPAGENSYIERVTLEGTEPNEFGGFGLGSDGIRGIAVDATHVYWANQREEAIGRAPLADLNRGGCFATGVSCQTELVKPTGSLEGLAVSGTHLYWSVNGETPPNPGSDLYRYDFGAPPGEELSDLIPDSSLNGAEVKGVIGGSADGSYLYFVANGALDGAGEATPGDCRRPEPKDPSFIGACNLYLLHGGETTLIARLDPGENSEEDRNWLPDQVDTRIAKSAALSADGQTLLFRSAQDLGGYQTDGTYQLYRYRVGQGLTCISCDPGGEGGIEAGIGVDSTFGNAASPISYTGATTVRFLSAGGDRAFFETAAALVPADTNGQAGCPAVGGHFDPACQDVYEWEAPGSGTCTQGGPGYFPANRGCLYLISPGTGPGPSYFADASPDGSDVYLLTREQLVGQDTDHLLDFYDARVDGGLAAQNPLAKPVCEGEGCKPAATPPPPFTAPPDFSGPPDPAPKRPKCAKPKKSKQKSCNHKKHRACKKKRCGHKRPGGSR